MDGWVGEVVDRGVNVRTCRVFRCHRTARAPGDCPGPNGGGSKGVGLYTKKHNARGGRKGAVEHGQGAI